jgi:hypothetical protein
MPVEMGWANWRHQHCEQKAVRLHVKLRLADLQPGGVVVWHQLGWGSGEELARLPAAGEAARQRRAAAKKQALAILGCNAVKDCKDNAEVRCSEFLRVRRLGGTKTVTRHFCDRALESLKPGMCCR